MCVSEKTCGRIRNIVGVDMAVRVDQPNSVRSRTKIRLVPTLNTDFQSCGDLVLSVYGSICSKGHPSFTHTLIDLARYSCTQTYIA